MENIKIAAVIPLYNTENYIEECLNSIVSQTYPNFICVIVNDGSTDKSPFIAERFARTDALHRFIIIHKANSGVSAARNTALNYLQSLDNPPELLCFIDSDDLIPENYFENYISVFMKYDADLMCSGYVPFAPHQDIQSLKLETKEKACNLSEQLLAQHEAYLHIMSLAPFDNESFWNGMYLWNKGIRFSLLGDLRFDETMPISEDITFIWQLFLKAKKYALAPHSFYIYRQRSSSVIHLAHKLHTWFSCDIKMIDGFLDGPYPEDFKQVLRIKLFELYYFHLTQSIHAGLKNDGKYFFDRLSRHWSLYKQLCPAKHSKKIRRVIFGWRFNYHYLRFRKKQSEKRKLRVGKKPLPLFP